MLMHQLMHAVMLPGACHASAHDGYLHSWAGAAQNMPLPSMLAWVMLVMTAGIEKCCVSPFDAPPGTCHSKWLAWLWLAVVGE